ncbi:putative galacturonosyltransferase 14 [Capsicum baccatum]|uniref:Hexosyltransferase n=1 Tax=Capsicum baccatum TaxID=33114 RepID=A0A2G2VNM0_CAPBA|nr:putative galacturonosyltransferase 14 [Capsicum baccatum]
MTTKDEKQKSKSTIQEWDDTISSEIEERITKLTLELESNLILVNLNSGFELWNLGELPPSLIAFEGHVHQIDLSRNIAGLGYRSISNVVESILENGAVIHFNGSGKPWIKIRAPEM